MLAVARTVADAPDVREAVAGPDPTARLQPLAEQVRRDTGTDFVVVMTVDGVRFTHPDTSQIGKHYLGTIAPAANGESITETYTGTLGPSVRAVVPVRDGTRRGGAGGGRPHGRAVSRALTPQLVIVLGRSRWRSRWPPAGRSWSAVAAAHHPRPRARRARPDATSTTTPCCTPCARGWCCSTARGGCSSSTTRRGGCSTCPTRPSARGSTRWGCPRPRRGARPPSRASDEIHLTAERIVVVNQQQARWDGRRLGTVVTLRDHTELRALVSELATVRGFADSLTPRPTRPPTSCTPWSR